MEQIEELENQIEELREHIKNAPSELSPEVLDSLYHELNELEATLQQVKVHSAGSWSPKE